MKYAAVVVLTSVAAVPALRVLTSLTAPSIARKSARKRTSTALTSAAAPVVRSEVAVVPPVGQ